MSNKLFDLFGATYSGKTGVVTNLRGFISHLPAESFGNKDSFHSLARSINSRSYTSCASTDNSKVVNHNIYQLTYFTKFANIVQ
jgi:hypothetical protein